LRPKTVIDSGMVTVVRNSAVPRQSINQSVSKLIMHRNLSLRQLSSGTIFPFPSSNIPSDAA